MVPVPTKGGTSRPGSEEEKQSGRFLRDVGSERKLIKTSVFRVADGEKTPTQG